MTPVRNETFGDDQRPYIQAALESFMQQLQERQGIHDMLIAWLRANTEAGGVGKRPKYSMPREYLSEYAPFARFTAQRSELSEEQWAYCFDFSARC